MKIRKLLAPLIILYFVVIVSAFNAYAFSSEVGDRDWKWPVPSSRNLSSCFPNYCGHSSLHLALDITQSYGSAIYASYKGTVLYASAACNQNYGKPDAWCPCGKGTACLGNFVYIRHTYNGKSYVSRYGHMQNIYVKTGDAVTRNTIIGTIGSTGSSTGPHLDFTIWEGNSTTRPSLNYMVDPFLNQFLEADPVPALTDRGCPDNYLNEVKALYSQQPLRNPQGYLESLIGETGTIKVRGWVFDRDALSKGLEIHVYADGKGAAHYVGSITANGMRMDVNNAYPGVGNYHGFNKTLGTSLTGTHKFFVYAHNEGRGKDVLLGEKTVTITKPNVTQPKKTQTISANSFIKTIGNPAFSLGASTSGNGKLTYSSGNTSVATVSYTGTVTIKGIGTATITITAAKTSTHKEATKAITVSVRPKSTTISSLKSNSSGKLKITWNRNSSVTGYRIQVATNSNFSNAKTYIITNNNTLAKTISAITGKTYYVRIRTYKGNLVSSWSGAEKLKIAK